MKNTTSRRRRMERMVRALQQRGIDVQIGSFKMRPSQDVPNFLKRLDEIYRRSAKSTLHFGAPSFA